MPFLFFLSRQLSVIIPNIIATGLYSKSNILFSDFRKNTDIYQKAICEVSGLIQISVTLLHAVAVLLYLVGPKNICTVLSCVASIKGKNTLPCLNNCTFFYAIQRTLAYGFSNVTTIKILNNYYIVLM